jgi:hypothetical protein
MTARLTRRNYGSGHSYTLDGDKVDGVTTVLNALPKQLTQWSSDQAANYAVEHWDELAEEPLTRRLDRIRFAHRDALRTAGLRGTQLHGYGERLVAGEAVEIPDEHRGPAEAYARFLDRWQIEPIATETPLASTRFRYAGTADLWARVGARDHARALVDLKTGRNVYESTVLQLAAYRHTDLWQPDGPDSEAETPEVDLVYVAHVLPDDVRLLPVTAGPNELREFLYVQQTSQWLARHGFRGEEPLIGDAETIDRAEVAP